MPVTVRQQDPTSQTTDEIAVPLGEDFVVEQGDLVVLGTTDGRRVAVFRSGTWLSATLQD